MMTFSEVEVGVEENEPFWLSVKDYDGHELVFTLEVGQVDGIVGAEHEFKLVFSPTLYSVDRLIKVLEGALYAAQAWRRKCDDNFPDASKTFIGVDGEGHPIYDDDIEVD